MKALVTGGTGFVGGAIVHELLRRGHQVRVLARESSRTEPLEKLGVEIARGDILEPAPLTGALRGCDVLFHAAAIYELWVPDEHVLMRTEIEGTTNVLEAALTAGVSQVVCTSTGATIGEPKGVTGNEQTTHRGYFLTPYERAKYEAEQVAESYRDRLGIVFIHPAAVLGPGDLKPTGQSLVNLLNGRFPALFDGTLTFADIGDVAAAHVIAAEKQKWGEHYIVAAQTMNTVEFFDLACRLAGLRRPPVVPGFIAGLFARYEEWKARRGGGTPLMTRGSFDLAAHGFRVDGAKAARELGLRYEPVDESLRRAFQWYWDQGLLTRKPACVE